MSVVVIVVVVVLLVLGVCAIVTLCERIVTRMIGRVNGSTKGFTEEGSGRTRGGGKLMAAKRSVERSNSREVP